MWGGEVGGGGAWAVSSETGEAAAGSETEILPPPPLPLSSHNLVFPSLPPSRPPVFPAVCIGTNSRPLPTDGSQDATLVAVPTCAKVEPPPSKWGKARVVDAGVEAGEAGEAEFDTGAGAPVDGKKVGAKSASDTDKLMEIVHKLKAATGKSAKKAAAPAKKP